LSVDTKYLRQYAEPEARALLDARLGQHWQNVVVIPAYRESPDFLHDLPVPANTLLILVLNRPDSDPDTHCNDGLRDHVMTLPTVQRINRANASLHKLPEGGEILLMERLTPLPEAAGVGLARKIGCDAALALGAIGCISSQWIHCSDADAQLPVGYFQSAAAVTAASALVYPFRHTPPDDQRERMAIDVYERYLQHYVDGLASAGSPYAFHTLGSCIAVNTSAYAQVRGFPRRAGAEDFYLLNKLAKQGSVIVPDCQPIVLSARLSQRVPFGTGPALRKLLSEGYPEESPLFYHPRCFDGLRLLIRCIMHEGHPGMTLDDLERLLAHAPDVRGAARDLGIVKFLAHGSSQCASNAAFVRHFHQWFDGFKTLKFVHALATQWGRMSWLTIRNEAMI
jgi:hypothetical protein